MGRQFPLILLIFGICSGVVYANYGGGSGTEEDPYLISDPNHMQAIGTNLGDWDKHFKLIANIDLSRFDGQDGRPAFNLIGNDSTAFSGVFDGNYHTISNFICNSGLVKVGLFRSASHYPIVIKNLGLINPNVSSTGDAVGALVGNLNSIISGCYVKGGSVSSGSDSVGGLVGQAIWGGLTNCYTTCEVYGDQIVGGLIGLHQWGHITNCYCAGEVVGGDQVGGLIGWTFASGHVEHCYSVAWVDGDSNVGALTGKDEDIGIGRYTKCFWDENVWDTGIGNEPDPPDVMSRTTAQMQTQSTYTDHGWDFVGEVAHGTEDIWYIGEEPGFPKLSWQISFTGDFLFPPGVRIEDLLLMAGAWLSGSGDDNWQPECDISEPADNIINGVDFGVFSGNWQKGF
jgi:hypothetical protein